MTTTIEVTESELPLIAVLELVKAGHEVILTVDGCPVARVTAIAPAAPPARPRIAGLHEGAVWVSDDFDEPLSDEFWLGSE